MNLTDYGRKYGLSLDTVKAYIARGSVRGEKLTDGGSWFVHDEAPVRVIDTEPVEPDRVIPKTRDIINSISYLVNREIIKITAWSESLDKTLPMGTLRTVSDLMDKMTRLRREDNAVLKTLQVTKMTDEFLEELIDEFDRRQKLEAEANVSRIDSAKGTAGAKKGNKKKKATVDEGTSKARTKAIRDKVGLSKRRPEDAGRHE